jgi:hypothetical protein
MICSSVSDFNDDESIRQLTHGDDGKDIRNWLHPQRRRQQLMALIITVKAESVSKRIMTDLGRGVTVLSGKGMFTGQDRSVLLCALTLTEVHNLKHAVVTEDPTAFVVVSSAQEVLGRGFNPLREAWMQSLNLILQRVQSVINICATSGVGCAYVIVGRGTLAIRITSC